MPATEDRGALDQNLVERPAYEARRSGYMCSIVWLGARVEAMRS
jgi:hypothetical protein